MTHAEAITAHARKWLKRYTEARKEDQAPVRVPYYNLAIAQRTEQVLCTHPDIRHLYGELWECTVCGGVSR